MKLVYNFQIQIEIQIQFNVYDSNAVLGTSSELKYIKSLLNIRIIIAECIQLSTHVVQHYCLIHIFWKSYILDYGSWRNHLCPNGQEASIFAPSTHSKGQSILRSHDIFRVEEIGRGLLGSFGIPLEWRRPGVLVCVHTTINT